MAELTDEEALNQAETFVSFFKSAKRLEELTRYIRNARRDFPEMQRQLADYQGQIETAKAAAEAAQGGLQKIKASMDAEISSLSSRRDELVATVNRLGDQATATLLRSEHATERVADLEARATTLSASVSSLTEEENILRVKVADYEGRLAELRRSAAELAG